VRDAKVHVLRQEPATRLSNEARNHRAHAYAHAPDAGEEPPALAQHHATTPSWLLTRPLALKKGSGGGGLRASEDEEEEAYGEAQPQEAGADAKEAAQVVTALSTLNDMLKQGSLSEDEYQVLSGSACVHVRARAS
jgi:hypothetical protein